MNRHMPRIGRKSAADTNKLRSAGLRHMAGLPENRKGQTGVTKEQICILIAMVLYMLAVLAIGLWCARRNRTSDDFYLGGRKLGPLVTAMSAEASDMSSWLLMGLPGLAYLTGIADAGWTAIGLAVGTYINWLVVAKRLRRYTVVANNSITLPDFFSNRIRR